jgi:hypothetical protein
MISILAKSSAGRILLTPVAVACGAWSWLAADA